MNKKNNVLTIVLVLGTLVLGGLSFYIAMQISQPADQIVQEEIKPEDVAYKKDVQFNQISPTQTQISGGGLYNEDRTLKVTPTLTASREALLAKNSTASAGTIGRLTPTRSLLSNRISPTSTIGRIASSSGINLVATPISNKISPTSTTDRIASSSGINLVTTPIVTSTLARTLLTGTVSPQRIASGTARPTVKSLPSAGMFNTTLIIFAAAISMIFFSFLL